MSEPKFKLEDSAVVLTGSNADRCFEVVGVAKSEEVNGELQYKLHLGIGEYGWFPESHLVSPFKFELGETVSAQAAHTPDGWQNYEVIYRDLECDGSALYELRRKEGAPSIYRREWELRGWWRFTVGARVKVKKDQKATVGTVTSREVQRDQEFYKVFFDFGDKRGSLNFAGTLLEEVPTFKFARNQLVRVIPEKVADTKAECWAHNVGQVERQWEGQGNLFGYTVRIGDKPCYFDETQLEPYSGGW